MAGQMILEILFLIGGILGLWLSAELLIRASQIIAGKLRISETFIGLTILSIGTSLPEIGVHISSSLRILKGIDVSDLAVATNIGSNTVQITAILGIIALFMRVHSTKKFMMRDYILMMCSIILLFLFCLDGVITRIEGFILLFSYILYLAYLAQLEHFVYKIEHNHPKKRVILFGLLIPFGLLALFFFSDIIVDSARLLLTEVDVTQSLVGALIVGVGTALPELAGAIIALKRKSSGMSLGILVGSNITGPLFAVGIGALISSYTVSSRIIWFDLPAWFFVSAVVMLMFWRKLEIGKKEAIALLLIYIVYVFVRIKFIG
jgi:cation:H+ antiporter